MEARVTPEEIRALRERLGLTQQQMADKIGTTNTTISRWELGTARPRGLYLREIKRLARSGRNDAR